MEKGSVYIDDETHRAEGHPKLRNLNVAHKALHLVPYPEGPSTQTSWYEVPTLITGIVFGTEYPCPAFGYVGNSGIHHLQTMSWMSYPLHRPGLYTLPQMSQPSRNSEEWRCTESPMKPLSTSLPALHPEGPLWLI